eukprot:snap_masked-scaffold_13-processed-gene-4.29-mRNA-1 protein AED:1.00 eAED:1.00 QI:0/-1/0/0/-1/1/1/0/234
MYSFRSEEAQRRFTTNEFIRSVDYTLGYPILLVDDNGNYLKPRKCNSSNDVAEYDHLISFSFEFGNLSKAEVASFSDLKNGLTKEVSLYCSNENSVHGTGVFTKNYIPKNSFVGLYLGEVCTYESAEDLPEKKQNFLVYLNDGASGVAVDGGAGKVNELKYLNHSCSPNLVLREIFNHNLNHWIVAAVTLQDIQPGEELLQDADLHTEDENLASVECLCNASNCRKFLYQFHRW